MQGIFLPAMAIAFAVAPLAGQNFGARKMDRVRETFRVASMQSTAVMLSVMVLCQWQPEALVRFFSSEPEVIEVGALFLKLISWNFAMGGITFICSGLFQALGNTLPALASSLVRLFVYALPAIWLTTQPGYKIEHIWYLSIAAAVTQMTVSVLLLRRQMRQQLGSPALTQPA
jgi:Na+-driven multidrug efflux pump